MKKIKKIGVFDSGVGGLSVLKSLINEISFEKIIYYGDTARVPYGNKDKDTIVRFCLEALEFFNHFELDLLIVACNTASAHALKAMRECSSIPIIGVIESGVMALSRRNLPLNSEILVLATEATIKSRVYDSALRNLGYTNVTNIATNLFVSLVEENIFKGEVIDSVFNHYFCNIKKPKAVILGCTHFPLLLESLRGYFGEKTIFIHSGEAIANFICENFKVDSKNCNFIGSKVIDSIESNLESNVSRDSNIISNLDSMLDSSADSILDSNVNSILDSSADSVLDSNLDSSTDSNITKVEFFASDNVAKLRHTAKLWLKDTQYKDVE